jgi:hypothetical protein
MEQGASLATQDKDTPKEVVSGLKKGFEVMKRWVGDAKQPMVQ